ncbi:MULTISPECIES: hypothetical protein [Acinetobacter]|uniref:Tape measure protein n=1 Tax=Acinetobacter baumannii TaxID=470 RepID=A0ABD5DB38_ACIBA|nr:MULTISPECIES: hypothetical protein [Acinetobacter]EHU2760842.1 hypothetical protein [Acinetobacter baumannii]EHU3119793.1 hypothetical protein [Acinetobacter baumannii]EJB8489836.1 hypothetical protein [Acinetobacter baumannii]EKV7389810.1 hypothetical protein [Acinetobacter baumannii]EKW3202864.1 hypothetical protein [Acinetobacter baumannii]
MEDTSQLHHRDLSLLSDDELSNIDPSQLIPEAEEELEEAESQPQDKDEVANAEDAGQQADDETDPEESEQPVDTDPESAAPEKDEPAAEGDESQKQELETSTDDDIDYKAFYEKVTASFKANGRDIRVTDPDDIVSLMQRGAGFAKKMATLKPSMRVLRTLENHGITEQDLGFLIDLHKKNPDAINKLIKDSGVDVYSLDAEKATSYKAQAQLATDNEVELESVIQDLSVTSPTFTKTLDIVVNQWDAQSQSTVANNPHLLQLLDGHMQRGYFDMVMSEVERLRAIGGHIDGLSDLDAYAKVGDALNQRGAFNQAPAQAPKVDTPAAPTPDAQTQPEPKQDLNAKRRAASNPRPKATVHTQEPDLSAMSDEEVLNFLSRR